MAKSITDELDYLSSKIDRNTADIEDYYRYESLLLTRGLSQEYVHSYLNKGGFDSWEELIAERRKKERDKNREAVVIGGLLGIALGLFLAGSNSSSKK